MRPATLIVPLLAALALTGTAQAGAAPPSGLDGSIWENPYHSVKVRTGNCAGKLCGWVVWATPEAQADARDSGTAWLIGTPLLEDYPAAGPGWWRGHVFVPDMGHTFTSTIALIDDRTLKVSGCVLGGMICKSQIWHKD
jgi:uncharacterized protein (DUF2147 family)